MAGLVPAIHVFVATENQDVDARVKRGHDEFVEQSAIVTMSLWHDMRISPGVALDEVPRTA